MISSKNLLLILEVLPSQMQDVKDQVRKEILDRIDSQGEVFLNMKLMRVYEDEGKIAAIKFYRSNRSVSLKEAVDYVNSMSSTFNWGRSEYIE